MYIHYKNYSEISKIKGDIMDIIKYVIKEMDPRRLVRSNLQIKNNILVIGRKYKVSLNKLDNLYLVGFGKSSGAMAEEAEKIIGDYLSGGYVNILKGTQQRYSVKKIKFCEAEHPIPIQDNLKGTEKIVELLNNAGRKDVILMLISGGGSALLTLPKKFFSLNEIANVTKIVMEAGATINELNTVRKHLSKVKGGNLARYAYPARVYSLILSDVIGDPLDTIASGPTAPDTSTYRDAYNVLKKYSLISKVPRKIIEYFKRGINGLVEETPKPGDKIFTRVRNIIVGNNNMALKKAAQKATDKGYRAKILSSYIEGEARHVGIFLAGLALEISRYNRPFRKPIILFGGGETTVTVKRRGVGGRNQEIVLSAGIKISGHPNIIIASIGTDGIDGNSPAAGAITDGSIMENAIKKGIDAYKYLCDNDTYSFFSKIGGSIITGPTDTNVNDIMILSIAKF